MRSLLIGEESPLWPAGVAEAKERRSNCDVAIYVVGVRHLVDAHGAGRDPFRIGRGGLGVAPQDRADLIYAGGRPRRKGHYPAILANYGRPGLFLRRSKSPPYPTSGQMSSRRL